MNSLRFEDDAKKPTRRPGFGQKPMAPRYGTRKEKTSWEPVAKQYGKMLEEDGTFQSEVIFPGAVRLMAPKRGMKYLDIACGEGSFVRALANAGGEVVGFDLSSSLIKQAEAKKIKNATFRVANAKDFARYFDPASFDGASCNLALQNISELESVVKDAAAVLKKGAPFVMVINHPAFRIPRQTGWGFDEKRALQYRRVDSYMTPNEIPIVANPGQGAKSAVTYSFHRPLETYVKELSKAGFMIDAIEEWISHRESDSGPKAKAENRARKEIPMFMAIRARKV
jgi:ubiquinone/menaquinone biosynthesis C-methylase UbiE